MSIISEYLDSEMACAIEALNLPENERAAFRRSLDQLAALRDHYDERDTLATARAEALAARTQRVHARAGNVYDQGGDVIDLEGRRLRLALEKAIVANALAVKEMAKKLDGCNPGIYLPVYRAAQEKIDGTMAAYLDAFAAWVGRLEAQVR